MQNQCKLKCKNLLDIDNTWGTKIATKSNVSKQRIEGKQRKKITETNKKQTV